VAHYTHDRHPRTLEVRLSDLDAPAKGRFVLPPALGHAFADERNFRGVGTVAGAEEPARAQRNVQRAEIFGTRHLVHAARLVARLDRPAFDGEISAAGMIAIR